MHFSRSASCKEAIQCLAGVVVHAGGPSVQNVELLSEQVMQMLAMPKCKRQREVIPLLNHLTFFFRYHHLHPIILLLQLLLLFPQLQLLLNFLLPQLLLLQLLLHQLVQPQLQCPLQHQLVCLNDKE